MLDLKVMALTFFGFFTVYEGNLSDSKWRLLSLVEIAYYGWSFASLTFLRKVEEEPQLLVVFVVTATVVVALEEEHMACLDQ